MTIFTPRRHRGVELLDDPSIDPALRARSMRDVVRSNVLFGGRRAALREIARAVVAPTTTLLDVGTGLADIPAAARREAARRGIELVTIGVDEAPSLLAADGERLTWRVAGSALALPFAARSVDVVVASQLLHHFVERDAVALLGELARVARRRVIVSDLRRSWLAAAGFWLASWPLGFHRITRRDGTTSVLRGFTPEELRALVRAATGGDVAVRRRLGFRLTASWSPTPSPHA